MKNLGLAVYLGAISAMGFATSLPSHFDLRNQNGNNYVSVVKTQQGGTSWAYATVAAIESDLMKTNTWVTSGESGEASLSENHMDWWNGFNQHYNADVSPHQGGMLAPHEGGDFKIAAAYLARGEGAVRKLWGPFYTMEPEQTAGSYHRFYVRDIDWLSAGSDLSRINEVKQAIMDHGALASAISWSMFFYSSSLQTFYQPAFDPGRPNHAIAIVGWDDQKVTQAARPGAWLAKNSWGTRFGQGGFFWIAYDDKIVAKDPELGAVSFNHVEPQPYHQIYYHDYHGWRDTKSDVSEAFNAFVAKGGDGLKEVLKSISFYTAANKVQYTAKVYGKFDGNSLSDELATLEGQMLHRGHHTVDLTKRVELAQGRKFYVYLKLSAGGQAVDGTRAFPLLLENASSNIVVVSSAKPGQSFYRSGTKWVDLTNDDWSANFCMKALTLQD